VLPGGIYRVRAVHRELGTGEWRTVEVGGGAPGDVDLTVPGDRARPATGTIRGRVRFGGAPIRAVVRAQPGAGAA
jgi:hypothetical protein